MDARVQVYSEKMQKAYEFLTADFAAIRAGRANPHVLDKLRVDYYGTPTPIQQVGNVPYLLDGGRGSVIIYS